MKKRIAALVMVSILILACLAGCSSNAKDAAYNGMEYSRSSSSSASGGAYAYASESADADDYYFDEAEYEKPMSEEEPALSGDSMLSTGNIDASRKIIRNANISLQTKEFNASVEKLQSIVTELGGYISQADVSVYNSYYELHSANYTVRIPAENFDRFVARREDIGSVNSTYVWTNDVTDSYYDMQARLDTLETKRARLLELLEQAEDMEDIITLESALSDTIYEIERNTGSLRRLDDQIAYSTISVYLEEVREVTEPVAMPKTLGERISQQFSRTINNVKTGGEDFIVWFIGALPVLLILAILVVVLVLIIRRGAKKRAAKRAQQAALQAEAAARWQAAQNPAPQPAPTQDTEHKDV